VIEKNGGGSGTRGGGIKWSKDVKRRQEWARRARINLARGKRREEHARGRGE